MNVNLDDLLTLLKIGNEEKGSSKSNSLKTVPHVFGESGI